MRYLVFASLLFFSANIHAQETIYNFSGKAFTYALYTDTSKCKSESNASVDSILIKDKASKKSVQVINLNKMGSSPIPCDIAADFLITDANFDGHEDILLMQFLPAAPNIPYYYWIYNTASKKFVEDTALENITSPQFDSVKHQITSFWRNGCCDHGTDTYSYLNNKATLIQQEEDVADPNGTAPDSLFVRKIINGKLQVVSRKVQK